MAIDLAKEITTTPIPRARMIVAYGKGGVGKTKLLATACKQSNGLMVLTGEDGLSPLQDELGGVLPSHVRVGVGTKTDIDTLSQNWEDFCDILKQLIISDGKIGDKKFTLLATDPFSSFMQCFDAFVVKKHFGGDYDKANAYRAKFQFYLQEFSRVLQAFDILMSKGITVLISCHGVIVDYRDPSNENYKKWDLLLPGSEKINIAAELYNRADSVLFATFETEVKENKATGGKRVLLSADNPSYTSKDRIGFPDKMLLDWNIINGYLNKKKG